MSSSTPRREQAVAALTTRCPSLPALEIVDSLAKGIAQLEGLLSRRIHKDVESLLSDSMLAPISGAQELTQLERASLEIDACAAIVVADEVTHGGYVPGTGEWILDWVMELCGDERLSSKLQTHAQNYQDILDKDRRVRLATKLQHAVPESIRTPAVLYHLFLLAVRIVAAMAFRNSPRGEALRSEQRALLPAISDCRKCHGRILAIGESCASCGNPLWNFEWLKVM